MTTLTHPSPDTVFRAIADPTRREILALLRRSRRTVGELASHFPVSRPAISKHLRVLEGAGLVVTRQVGTSTVCDLDAAPLQMVGEWLREYDALWGESLRNLKSLVESEEERA